MKYIIAVVLSAILITQIHASPVNKQVIHSASVHRATVAKQTSTPKQNVVPQPETKVAAVITPTPQPTRFASGCNTYDSLFRQYDWSVTTAEAICEAESSGNPYAVSYTDDYGLMQINHIHADMVNGDLTALYNPTENIAVAYRIYSAHGWTAWSTYLNGSYSRFL